MYTPLRDYGYKARMTIFWTEKTASILDVLYTLDCIVVTFNTFLHEWENQCVEGGTDCAKARVHFWLSASDRDPPYQ